MPAPMGTSPRPTNLQVRPMRRVHEDHQMKCTGYENHYKQITPPKGGLQKEGSQLTGLARNKSKLPFNCDHCGMAFEKYACWAKRVKHNYCSRACASAAKVIRFPKECVVCGVEMLLTPTLMKRVAACSTACMRKRRVTTNCNMRSSPDYTAIAKRLKKDATCDACGTKKGPWRVVGVKTWVEDGLACANGDEARLVCMPCHMRTLTPLSRASTYMRDRFEYYKEKS